MAKRYQTTEYWVRELDEWGDTLDIHFCDTLREARSEAKRLAEYEITRVKRIYRHDGELLDEEETDIE